MVDRWLWMGEEYWSLMVKNERIFPRRGPWHQAADKNSYEIEIICSSNQ